jgi:hypothetical protein
MIQLDISGSSKTNVLLQNLVLAGWVLLELAVTAYIIHLVIIGK